MKKLLILILSVLTLIACSNEENMVSEESTNTYERTSCHEGLPKPNIAVENKAINMPNVNIDNSIEMKSPTFCDKKQNKSFKELVQESDSI